MYGNGKFITTYPLKDGKFTVPQRTLEVIIDMAGKEDRNEIEFISDTTESNSNGEVITKTYTLQNMKDLIKSNSYTVKDSAKGAFKLYEIDTKDLNFFFTGITNIPLKDTPPVQPVKMEGNALKRLLELQDKINKLEKEKIKLMYK